MDGAARSNEITALREEMLREFADVKERQDATNGRVRDLELWQAQARGFLYAVALAAGLPSIVVAVLYIFGAR